MYAQRCVLEGKSGIEELAHRDAYAIIANRTLYDRGKAHKFTLVNVKRSRIENVYPSLNEARSALRTTAPR